MAMGEWPYKAAESQKHEQVTAVILDNYVCDDVSDATEARPLITHDFRTFSFVCR